jgi:UDP-N-acetyl-D-mannosaminuronate dehydrogenase
MQQDVVLGMGEIGSAFYDVLKKSGVAIYGKDLFAKMCKGKEVVSCDVLHICIPYKEFQPFMMAVQDATLKFTPKEIIIHSSVSPGTTENLSEYTNGVEVFYSPFRGVHKRMGFDMMRYTKYWASVNVNKIPSLFVSEMQKAKVNIKSWGDTPTSLELAKDLMDVVYYGWEIVFAQHVKVLAERYGVDDKKLWDFTDEIHKHLGNRPRMFSGEGIGGHCVMQDKDLLNDPFLDMVFSHDQYYRRNLKNGR